MGCAIYYGRVSEIIVAPSLLAADLLKIEREVLDIEATGVSWLHLDVMDGSFVPPITFGANMVKAVGTISDLYLDTHLMVQEPQRHIKDFQEAGADRLTVHYEACPDLAGVLKEIRAAGISAGVAINPDTPAEVIFDVLWLVDLALVMTVHPGWGGQKFISKCLPKIAILKKEILKQSLEVLIEVDGGINETTAKDCLQNGADVLVAGSYIFGATNRESAVRSLLL